MEIVLGRLEASGEVGITKRANACYGVPVAHARAPAAYILARLWFPPIQ